MSPSGEWWKTAVFYEVYIRSFADGDGDGVGDLSGVAARLGYLEDLGVNALWITPFYPSPQIDNGYDISDHEGVDPLFGALGDFDRLIAAAHRRNIKVVTDIVLNHTSDQHRWFVDSRRSRDAAYRNWYIWRDGQGDGRPPNNWESAFGGSAWTYDTSTAQWYYHFFYPEQPDLNWRHPAVEERMLQTLSFWLDRGVDGFRLDAVNTLFEDPGLRDNPPLAAPTQTITGVYTQDFVHNRRLPEVHDVLRRVRTFVERRAPGAVLISEAYVDAVSDMVCFYGKGDEMHLPFNFFLAQVPTADAAGFRRTVEEVEAACGERWPSLVLSNHDIARAIDRYGAQHDAAATAKLLATLLLTLRGTPFIYYREEIAMPTEDAETLAEVCDPVGRVFWPHYKGRDGARRPMQWATVDAQRADSRSVLNYYRGLLRLRRDSPALRSGGYRPLASAEDVFAYARSGGSGEVAVALNFGPDATPASLSDLGGGEWRVIMSSDDRRQCGGPIDPATLSLQRREAVVIERRIT